MPVHGRIAGVGVRDAGAEVTGDVAWAAGMS